MVINHRTQVFKETRILNEKPREDNRRNNFNEFCANVVKNFSEHTKQDYYDICFRYEQCVRCMELLKGKFPNEKFTFSWNDELDAYKIYRI